jgi:hypothetical protein
MSLIDEALSANAAIADGFDPKNFGTVIDDDAVGR